MKHLLLSASLLMASVSTFADSVTIKSLCDQGLEGSALATVKDSPADIGTFRMNLICVKDGQMVGTGWEADLGVTNLTFSAVEHETSLELSQVPLAGADRGGTSDGTSLSMAHFNIAELLSGQVEGWYINGNWTREKLVQGQVVQKFPPLSSFPSNPISEHDFNGTYALKVLQDVGHERKLIPTEIWFRISSGVLEARMRIDSQTMVPLVDGPPFDGSGRFEVTTASGNGEKTGRPIWHLRGYVSGPGKLVIYWINPSDGMSGPYEATKVFSSDTLFKDAAKQTGKP